MKKIVEVLLSRGFGIALSLAAQIGLWVIIFTVFQAYSSILVTAMLLLSFFCVLHIVIKDIYPEHKIAWILFMVVFPIAGGMFYLIYGSHRTSKETRQLHAQIEQRLRKEANKQCNLDVATLAQMQANRPYHYLNNIAHAPAFANTSVEYLPLGETMLQALIAELHNAEKFIFIESFIIEEGKMWGEIETVLRAKAKQGVDVRVLYDDVGCLMTLPHNFAKRLQSYGIQCNVFNKINHLNNANFNNRDHRKICVIDGNVGFNGGINLADEYINHKVKHGHWKDTAVMLKGDATYGLTLMFLSMWDMQTRQVSDYASYAPTVHAQTDGLVQPFADNPLDEHSVGESVYMSVLNTAKDYVYITSPYLIITREMTSAMVNAAKSGIDVRLIVPGIPDRKFVQFLSRSYYESLMKAGVKVFEYTPGFIHAKMFISDDTTAIVGTINLDYRSLDLHYECGTMMHGCSVIHDIKEDFLETQAKSRLVQPQDLVAHHPIIRLLVLGILRTFSPLL